MLLALEGALVDGVVLFESRMEWIGLYKVSHQTWATTAATENVNLFVFTHNDTNFGENFREDTIECTSHLANFPKFYSIF